jgi:hypothetical protein
MPTVSSKFLPETFIFVSLENFDCAIEIDAPLEPVDVTDAWAAVGAINARRKAINTRSAMRKG